MKSKKLKKIRTTMAVLLSAILAVGNIGGVMPFSQTVNVKAVDERYKPLNKTFTGTSEVWFELTESGEVTFEGSGDITLYNVLSYGNLEKYVDKIQIYNGKLRLPAGEYKAAGGTISKISFTPTSSYTESEWNDTFDTACEMETNSEYIGNLNVYKTDGYSGCTNDVDYFKFELKESGLVQIQYSLENILCYCSDGMIVGGSNVNNVVLYNSEGELITKLDTGLGVSEDLTKFSKRYRLPKGIYYIAISEGNNGYVNLSDYQIKVNYEPESPNDHEQEYNNTKDTANEIRVNTTYIGNIPTPDDKDYYKLSIPAKSKVRVKLQIPRKGTDEMFAATLYKEDGVSRIAEVSTKDSSLTAQSIEKTLEAGNYYVAVYSGKGEVNDNIDYKLTINVTGTEPELTTTPQSPTAAPQSPTTAPTGISYMPLNKVFEAREEVYFELPEYGTVSFEDCSGNTINVCIQPLLEDGSLGNYEEFIPETMGMSLKTGKYWAEINYYGYEITKINFTPAPNNTKPSNTPISPTKVPQNPTAVPSETTTIKDIFNLLKEYLITNGEDNDGSKRIRTTTEEGITTEIEYNTTEKCFYFWVFCNIKNDGTNVRSCLLAGIDENDLNRVIISCVLYDENMENLGSSVIMTDLLSFGKGSEQNWIVSANESVTKEFCEDVINITYEYGFAENGWNSLLRKSVGMTLSELAGLSLPQSTVQPVTSTKQPPVATTKPVTPTKQPPVITTKPAAPTSAPVVTNVPRPTDVVKPKETQEPGFIYVRSITLDDDLDDDETLRIGSEFNLYAEIDPEELGDVEIAWTTSNDRVARVKNNEDGDAEVSCIGAGTVTITATATDGSNVSVSKTYTIQKAKSSNNYLSKLANSQGRLSPSFKKTRTSYSLVLKKNMSQVVIRVTAADKKSTIKIDKKTTNKVTVKLKSGKSKTVKITVKAENGKSRVYKIKVKRK